MNDQILYGVAVVPAIVGLVQVAKQMGLPSQFAPGLAVLFGLLAGAAEILGSNWPPVQAVMVGVTLGLSASGLYSGAGTIAAALSAGNPTHLQDISTAPPVPVAAATPAAAHTEPAPLQPAPTAATPPTSANPQS